MVRAPPRRTLAELTFPEVSRRLKVGSILCLPLGAIEQHGAHLPLNTDMVVAEGLTRRIVAHWGEKFDLWQLPTLPLGLSREHDWAPGTLSLSIDGFLAVLRDLAGEIVRALPARNLAIINGHGGNRGVLENLLHELRGDFALNCCVIHPFDLSTADKAKSPDVHGGRDETAVMLALAPDLVRRELIATARKSGDPMQVGDLIFDRGVTWPWRTNDPRLGHGGIVGDAAAANAELGSAIIDSVVEEAGRVFARLLTRQGVTAGASPVPSRRRRELPARTNTRSGNRRRPRPKETS
jgi:creatinine amidohydrolase/Fe(II)-dependent formamide hydrolase-like protein